MPNWKKLITSGSDASLSSLTTTGNISGSATSTGSFGHGHFADNVGIGTNAPERQLHIQNSIDTRMLIESTGATAIFKAKSPTQAQFILTDTGASSNQQAWSVTSDGGLLNWRMLTDSEGSVAKDNILVLKYDGKVGIGTSSPNERLVVSATGYDARVTVDGTGTLGTAFPGLEFKHNSSESVRALIRSDYDNPGANLIFYTSNANPAEAMRIDKLGNVGIGTTSPGVALEVIGSVSGSSTSTGSFGRVNVAGNIVTTGNISGSASSTGSFGTYIGDGSQLTGISGGGGGGISLTNGVDNRVITATGAGSANAEANLTFDGSTLGLSGAMTATGNISGSSSSTGSFGSILTSGNIKSDTGNLKNYVYLRGSHAKIEQIYHANDVVYNSIDMANSAGMTFSMNTPILNITKTNGTRYWGFTTTMLSGSSSSTGSFGTGFIKNDLYFNDPIGSAASGVASDRYIYGGLTSGGYGRPHIYIRSNTNGNTIQLRANSNSFLQMGANTTPQWSEYAGIILNASTYGHITFKLLGVEAFKIGDGAFGSGIHILSGSSVSSASFGTGGITVLGDLSGSSTSTGSFGHLMQDGKGIPPQFTTGSSIYIGENAGANDDGSSNYNSSIGHQSLYSNTTGYHNTATGYQSLKFNTTGLYNTATGYQSLYSNTSGHYNVAIGKESLKSNTTGGKNIAIGNDSLKSNTSGEGNTAIGMGSLQSTTSGASNTAIGLYSLYYNTTGTKNVSSGVYSLRSNTTGNGNVASGYKSLFSNTTGGENISIGYENMLANTTGKENTSIGSYGLYNNTTGQENVSVGRSSLQYNTTGNYNTAVGIKSLYVATTGTRNTSYGYRSLSSTTTGTNNIAIGYQAGDNITTGASNIIIGYNVDAPSATSTNQLNIGNWIYGDGGLIGIGITSPTEVLHVAGNIFATGNISGSSTSTGSFGKVLGDGSQLTGINTDLVDDTTPQLGGDLDLNGSDMTGTGNINIAGDIRATGDIIAERYVVSSSVSHFTQSFSSGSTLFGDTADDTHVFVGNTISGSSTSTGSFGNMAIGTGVGGALHGNFGGAPFAVRTDSDHGIVIDPANYTIKSVSDTGGWPLKLSGNITFIQHLGTDYIEVGTTHALIPGSNSVRFNKPIHLDYNNSMTTGDPVILIANNGAAGTAAIAFGQTNTKIWRADNGMKIQAASSIRLYGNGSSNLAQTITNKEVQFHSNVTGSGNLEIAGNISGSSTSTGSFGAGYIDNKLGIGTVSPVYPLYVSKNSTSYAAYILNENTLYTQSAGLFVGVNGYSGVVNAFNVQLDSDGNAWDVLKVQLNGAVQIGNAGIAGGITTHGNISLGSNDDIIFFGNYAVHIGRISPHLLQLAGYNGIDFYDEANDISRMRIDSTGNVGIGTTNPTRALDVVGDIRATGDIIAERYVVSSSVSHFTQSFSSGSTLFGDTADDTHVFVGNTISGSSTSTGSFGRLEPAGNIIPKTDNSSNLGGASYRFANIYSADVQLSNEGTEGNEVDGTTGSWTIQEGDDDLYLLNRKNGKKYRFKLEEIK